MSGDGVDRWSDDVVQAVAAAIKAAIDEMPNADVYSILQPHEYEPIARAALAVIPEAPAASVLDEIATEALANSATWFPKLHQRGHAQMRLHFGIGFAEEAGEVAGVVKKANLCDGLMDSCELHADGKHSRKALADEMADAFTYLVMLAAHEGIDLTDAYRSKRAELVERWGAPTPGEGEAP